MVRHIDRRHQHVATGAADVATSIGTGRIGAELHHESQGYPFVANPRLVNVSFVFLLCVGCFSMLAGCVADDAQDSADGVITAQPAAADRGPTATTDTGTGFVLQRVAETDRGLAMAVRAGDDDFWLAERDGRIRLIEGPIPLDGGDADNPSMVVLDITDKVGTAGEGGLLGLDFSPGGDHLYVSYTDTNGDSVIAEYEMDGSAPVVNSERILLQVEQPFSNHNGGQVTFGPDGFLYIALGDGGSGGDPLGSGQDTSTLLGSILRIDPSGATADAPYAVPADNPFVEQANGREEIWLYGVRNPWRFSFDAATGDLWIGDVGQGEIEEIDFLPAAADEPAGRGANLGWNILEGEQPFSGENPPPDLIGPIAWYGHDNGRCSVTGGYVYRGERIPALEGVYVFGDYCTGELFGIRRSGDGRTTQAPLTVEGAIDQIVSFGQGPDGELYVFESTGTLWRLQNPETATDQ